MTRSVIVFSDGITKGLVQLFNLRIQDLRKSPTGRAIMPDGFMAQRSWSVQDAKNRFSEVVSAAHKRPQVVTEHGKPAVVVVDVAEYERLRQLERARAPSFTDLILAMPQDDGEFPRADALMRDLD